MKSKRFNGTALRERHALWWQLFADVPLRTGVDREQAVELYTLVIEHFERKYLAEMLNKQEFLTKREQFLSRIRFGIEERNSYRSAR